MKVNQPAFFLCGIVAAANGFGISPSQTSNRIPTQLGLDLGSVDTTTLGLGAAGLVAVGGIGLLVAGKGAGNDDGPASLSSMAKPEPEKIDVSIPYNAAAHNAFLSMGGKGDFAQFEEKYNAAAVEMVKAKKAARDAAAQMEAATKNLKTAESQMEAVLTA
mmetsp:Transcript_8162/g.12517  ORF Transcript_8162/g.12517 Transcript_8162/m.12517 type:complete len:161 (-) Transcript_8162:163-645(-)|eukprot:CAMPEP_0178895164 /NCGR_PEP_ID=MMETSP0786-20121207/431_1 /TAXON_ID=186022 /ORGANISM="Thalassionema frauenfeldii, Strain CCMP 1798" /LENGTH=160 /DNA_ID=CAMNT_0020565357 /DNA_START=188 /DNA_END=670 /DNA_ORIENTATION=-